MSKPVPSATPAPSGMSIDEELWFGSSDSEAAERAAAQSMAGVVGRIYGAKPFPEAARRLAELTRNDTTQLQEIVTVLEQDPALSAKLLRLVNSAGFGLRQRCTSVRHAVTLVGSKQLNQLATTAAVLDLFATESELSLQLLEHCTVVGAFSRYLGLHLGLPVDDLFTAGVLHDIGKLMLLDTFQNAYHAAIAEELGHADRVHLIERKLYGFDHGVLGAHVLKAWHIPDPIPKLVAWHHEPARAYSASNRLASLTQALRLADQLACAVTAGNAQAQIEAIAKLDAATYLGVSEQQLAVFLPELEALRARTTQREGADLDAPEHEVSQVRASNRPSRAEPLPAPRGFPCTECGAPSFGTTCPACQGYTCPTHPLRASGWCGLCTVEYERFTAETPFPIDAKKGAGIVALVAVLAVVFGSQSGSDGVARALVISLVAGLLLAGGLAIARRSYFRAQFLRTRKVRLSATPSPTSPAP